MKTEHFILVRYEPDTYMIKPAQSCYPYTFNLIRRCVYSTSAAPSTTLMPPPFITVFVACCRCSSNATAGLRSRGNFRIAVRKDSKCIRSVISSICLDIIFGNIKSLDSSTSDKLCHMGGWGIHRHQLVHYSQGRLVALFFQAVLSLASPKLDIPLQYFNIIFLLPRLSSPVSFVIYHSLCDKICQTSTPSRKKHVQQTTSFF